MRTVRNVLFGLLMLGWAVTYSTGVRAADWGCAGEDSYGQTEPHGPFYCQGSEDCCLSALAPNFSETVETFCEPYYGGPNWTRSTWEASSHSETVCAGLIIFCVCGPDQ
jgi:hypothetical protein